MIQASLSPIKEYAVQKGADISEDTTDFTALMAALKTEYGFIAPVFKGMDSASLIELKIAEEAFGLHRTYLERVDPREPDGNRIVGIVVNHTHGYRLIDGYHRFKWAITNRVESSTFILVE